MKTSFYRGNPIVLINEKWAYSDTEELVSENEDRACGKCNKEKTPDGHDPCLGILPGVMNACCGHGNPPEAYVQFENGVRIAGFILTRPRGY